jgi:hypothetical protein
MRKASAVAAITASSISTPGAIMLELPDSSRWDTTTARRDFRATSSRGSRPYGAKASRRHVEAEHLRGLRVDRQLVLAMVAAWGCYSATNGHVVLADCIPPDKSASPGGGILARARASGGDGGSVTWGELGG